VNIYLVLYWHIPPHILLVFIVRCINLPPLSGRLLVGNSLLLLYCCTVVSRQRTVLRVLKQLKLERWRFCELKQKQIYTDLILLLYWFMERRVLRYITSVLSVKSFTIVAYKLFSHIHDRFTFMHNCFHHLIMKLSATVTILEPVAMKLWHF